MTNKEQIGCKEEIIAVLFKKDGTKKIIKESKMQKIINNIRRVLK